MGIIKLRGYLKFKKSMLFDRFELLIECLEMEATLGQYLIKSWISLSSKGRDKIYITCYSYPSLTTKFTNFFIYFLFNLNKNGL